MRVLICDDNADAAETLCLAMRIDRHDVRACYDGRACIEHAREWHPEMAIVDINMPFVDGYEVARELRKLPGGDEILLIAVTGGVNQDERRALEAGFDFYFLKPAETTRLLKLARRDPGKGTRPRSH